MTRPDYPSAADRAMPGFERARIGNWVVRAANGSTGRANSACVLDHHEGADPDPIESLDSVEEWYRSRRLVPLIQVFDNPPEGLVDELGARGYHCANPTSILSGPLDVVRDRLGPPGQAGAVATLVEPPHFLRESLGSERLAEMASTSRPAWFACASRHDFEVAAGMAIADEALVGIFAMRTAADLQGQGLGREVLAALLAGAGEHECDTAWLQVEESNRRAGDWYRRLGMTLVGSYSYWRGR